MTPILWLMLTALATLWGGTFVLVGYLVRFLDPLLIATLRVMIAAPALWVIVAILRTAPPRGGRTWLGLLFLGLFNNALPFFLIFWGQQHISSGMAAALNSAAPLFGAVLGHLFTHDEKLTVARIVGLLIGLAGIMLLLQPKLGGGAMMLYGQLAVWGGALSYAIAGLVAKRLMTGSLSPLLTSAGQLTCSSLLLGGLTLLGGGFAPLATVGVEVWIGVLTLSLVCTALAYLLYFTIVRRAGAANALSVTLLIPVAATIMGALFLHERPGMTQIMAMGLILGGVFLAAHRGRNKVLATVIVRND